MLDRFINGWFVALTIVMVIGIIMSFISGFGWPALFWLAVAALCFTTGGCISLQTYKNHVKSKTDADS